MKNRKGFTLIELLVVIAIIGIIMLISFPMIGKLTTKNQESIHKSYRNILEKSAKKYMDDTGFLVSGCYEITFEDLKNQGMLNGIPNECSESKIYITSDDKGKATGYKVNLVCNGEKITQEYTNNQCEYKVIQYKDSYGGNVDQSGSNAPQLGEGFVPIKYDGKKWVTADSDNAKVTSNFNESYAWYDYGNKYWANAVILKSNTLKKSKEKYYPGQEIKEDNIKEWWVWISASKTNDKKGFWVEKYPSANETPTTFVSLYTKDYNRKRRYDSHTMTESEGSTLGRYSLFSPKAIDDKYLSSTGNKTGIYLEKGKSELYGEQPILSGGTLTYAFTYSEPTPDTSIYPIAVKNAAASLGNGCTIERTNSVAFDYDEQKYSIYCSTSNTNVYYSKNAGEALARTYANKNGSRCPSGDDICYYTVNTPLYPHSSVDLSYVSGANTITQYDIFGKPKGKLSASSDLLKIEWSGGNYSGYSNGKVNMDNLRYRLYYGKYNTIIYSYTTNEGDSNSLENLFAKNRNTDVGIGFNSGISSGRVSVVVEDTYHLKENFVSRAAIYVE